MKKILISFLLVVGLFFTPITAKAVDFDAALVTVYELEEKLNEMVILLRLGKANKIDGSHLGDVALTAAQIQTLQDDYASKKAEWNILCSQLP